MADPQFEIILLRESGGITGRSFGSVLYRADTSASNARTLDEEIIKSHFWRLEQLLHKTHPPVADAVHLDITVIAGSRSHRIVRDVPNDDIDGIRSMIHKIVALGTHFGNGAPPVS